jgi:hypothetical protein
MERYVTGLLSDLPHKTSDPIADVIAGTCVQLLQTDQIEAFRPRRN